MDCVLFKNFIEDLEKEEEIILFYISFGKSNIPLNNFLSKDFSKDSGRSSPAYTPTVIDNGFEITCRFQYSELRNFTKIYLLYKIRGIIRPAYAFNAIDFPIYVNNLKLDLSEFTINAKIITDHALSNIIYTHRHKDAELVSDLNRTPPMADVLNSIANINQLTKPSAQILTLNQFGVTNNEAQINQVTPDTNRARGTYFINEHLLEFNNKEDLGVDLDNVELFMITGSGYNCSLSRCNLNSVFVDTSNKVGSLKFFPLSEQLDNNPSFCICDGRSIDPNLYPEYNKIIGNKFGTEAKPSGEQWPKVPDLINGYVRSSGYIDVMGKQGYALCSQNPPTIRSHDHLYNQREFPADQSKGETNERAINYANGTTGNPKAGSQFLMAKSFIGVWGIKIQ